MSNPRSVTILEEPISGQAAGEDGDYLIADVSHVMRRGYRLHVSYVGRKHFVGHRQDSFALFSSGKSVMVIENAGAFSAKKLAQAAEAAKLVVPALGAQVLAMRQANEERRAKERAEFEASKVARNAKEAAGLGQQ